MPQSTKKQVGSWWGGLTPGKKKSLTIATLIAVVVIGSLIVYEMRGGRRASTQGYTKEELNLDTDLLEKSAYLEGQKNLKGMKSDIEGLQKVMKNIEEARTAGEVVLNSKPSSNSVSPIQQSFSQVERYPPPPQVSNAPRTRGDKPKLPGTVEPVRIIGEIGMVTNVGTSESDKSEKKKVESQVFLPPSFMEATLLSGLDAPTTTSAKGNPVPVLLRIKDLAFLPNRVRADLKGCFVIAEGHGNLADERAHLRLVTLSCLSKKGKAVINAKIKGFVVDTDGKIGLRGRVVSKMGSTIARAMLAGFFGGLGEAMTDQTEDVAISPLGETRSYDSSKVFQAGIGRGISTGAKELQKFYLALARQTMPVIEVGATRNITLVISEGTELKIRELINHAT